MSHYEKNFHMSHVTNITPCRNVMYRIQCHNVIKNFKHRNVKSLTPCHNVKCRAHSHSVTHFNEMNISICRNLVNSMHIHM